MTNSPVSLYFVGHCSHTDLLAEHLARTGAGHVTADADAADAVCVFERDASTHADLALPHLEAGRPVFVEKPMALRVVDATRLLEVGRATSFSTLRWAAGLGALQGATQARVVGPARPTDPSGWAFYAVHAVEIAQQLLGGVPGPVRVDQVGDGLRAGYTLNGRGVELDLSPARSEWAVSARLPDGTWREVLVTAGPGYFEPACREILAFARGGSSPVPVEEMVGVVSVIEAIAAA